MCSFLLAQARTLKIRGLFEMWKAVFQVSKAGCRLPQSNVLLCGLGSDVLFEIQKLPHGFDWTWWENHGKPEFFVVYHLVIQHSHGKSPFLIGKPSISMAMLNNQRISSPKIPNLPWSWDIKGAILTQHAPLLAPSRWWSQVSLAMHIPMLCLCAFLAELLATVVLCPAEDGPKTYNYIRVYIYIYILNYINIYISFMNQHTY